MTRRTLPMLWILSGCAWVSDTTIDELYPYVDDDGDGALNGNDCAPTDATISPAKPEIWYDGIDQNCDKANDFDQDADGFDGVEAGGNDCDDQDARISPAQSDPFYDGVDRNCDGAPDFDQDGDGYSSDNYVDETGSVGDDCVDQASDTPFEVEPSTVNPGAVETWYDGVDQNCDGNDDYDQDNDGFPCLDGVDANNACDADCDDTRADVNQRAAEVWYDGVNQDCSNDPNDFDQDGDGYDATPTGNDCDDLSDTIFPLAVEVLGDGVDADCDGDDMTVFAWSQADLQGISWSSLARPELVSSSAYLALTLSAGSAASEAGASYDGAVSLTWPRASAASSSPTPPIPSSGNLFNISGGTTDLPNLVTTGGHHSISGTSVLYDVVGVETSGSPGFLLAAVSASGALRASPAQVVGDPGGNFDSVVVTSDGTNAWLVGCASSTGALTYVSYILASSSIDTYETLDAGVDRCVGRTVGDDLWLYTVEGSDIVGWTLVEESGTVSLTEMVRYDRSALSLRMPETIDRTVLVVDVASDEVVVIDSAGGETVVAPGRGAVAANLAEDSSTGDWYFAYVTVSGDVRVTWDTAAGSEDIALTLPANFSPEDVAIWASGGVLVVAATGRDLGLGTSDVVVAQLAVP